MSSLNIILVEDHPVLRASNIMVLESAGYTIQGACGSAEEALDLLNSVAPDLLIIDISLPGMSGLELLEKLKAPRPKTIMLTGHDQESYREKAKEAGADAFLAKHDGPQALLELIKSFV